MRPDEWGRQRSAEWLWAERVQGEYRRGREDEADEQYQADWEAKHTPKAAERTATEQASIDAMKARMA